MADGKDSKRSNAAWLPLLFHVVALNLSPLVVCCYCELLLLRRSVESCYRSQGPASWCYLQSPCSVRFSRSSLVCMTFPITKAVPPMFPVPRRFSLIILVSHNCCRSYNSNPQAFRQLLFDVVPCWPILPRCRAESIPDTHPH